MLPKHLYPTASEKARTTSYMSIIYVFSEYADKHDKSTQDRVNLAVNICDVHECWYLDSHSYSYCWDCSFSLPCQSTNICKDLNLNTNKPSNKCVSIFIDTSLRIQKHTNYPKGPGGRTTLGRSETGKSTGGLR